MRGHINGCPYAGFGHPPLFPEEPGKPEVAYFKNSFVDQNVGRLQVTMNNPSFDDFLEAGGDLFDDFDGLVFIQFFVPTITFQISSSAKFHDQIDAVWGQNDVI